MESSIPPSYEEATTRDYWSLIAGYIASADLCAASLVSRRWHAIFAPWLWGNPGDCFAGSKNDEVGDRVYVALTRFKRALPRARLAVRELTHTLHLPPALPEIYDGPHPEWLRDVLEQLPNLQSLIVSRLPFFDHSALLALRTYSAKAAASRDVDFPTFPLRLLIAAQCANSTGAGLAEAFLHWPNLVFLDLSDTLAARDTGVLSSFRFMTGLQVLKLRHVHLRDDDVEVLAGAIGVRVRSLDIRDNRITDQSVRTLLSQCFHTTRDVHAGIGRNTAEEDWFPGVRNPDAHVLNEFRGIDLDERLVRRLTKGVVNRLPSEDLPQTGLTHLYIANNFITVEALASLLRTENLHVLDAGPVDTAKALGKPRTRTSISYPEGYSITLPGAEKLTPVLEKHAAKNLTYLRIHHAVLTETTAVKEDALSAVELPAEDAGRFEVDAEDSARHELDATVPVYELPEGVATPRYELAGDPMQFVVSLAIGDAPSSAEEEMQYPTVRRGSAFAPEVVLHDEDDTDEEQIVLTATGLGNMAQAVNGISAPSMDMNPVSPLTPTFPPAVHSLPDPISVTLDQIESKRHDLRARTDQPRGLTPGALPALQTLVLTDVPCFDAKEHVISRLQQFIIDCAYEAHLANLQASIEEPHLYVPGKPRSAHRTHRARSLFALRRIVLEMASPTSTSAIGDGVSPRSPTTPVASSWNFRRSRSTTEDPDTEAFWSAQENDFSFFGDEECGLPAMEPGAHFPLSSLAEKMVAGESEESPVLKADECQNREAPVGEDVVSALAAFRRERKILWERECQREGREKGVFVKGFWPGEVKVVRSG